MPTPRELKSRYKRITDSRLRAALNKAAQIEGSEGTTVVVVFDLPPIESNPPTEALMARIAVFSKVANRLANEAAAIGITLQPTKIPFVAAAIGTREKIQQFAQFPEVKRLRIPKSALE